MSSPKKIDKVILTTLSHHVLFSDTIFDLINYRKHHFSKISFAVWESFPFGQAEIGKDSYTTDYDGTLQTSVHSWTFHSGCGQAIFIQVAMVAGFRLLSHLLSSRYISLSLVMQYTWRTISPRPHFLEHCFKKISMSYYDTCYEKKI